MQKGSCRHRRATCKHSFSGEIDQTKRNKITPTNEEMDFTHQKPQSGLKRRKLDSSGKACRKALAGIAERPANTRSVEKMIKSRVT
ncbi:hypothetical protein KV679_12310 [Bacillus sp. JRC01]|nr:hypothetical protein [Bacillus sp. JRC01]